MENKPMNKSYLGLRLNGQFFYCSFPFSLDSYQGCTHNCRYCFSYFNYLLNCSTKGQKFFEEANVINFNTLKRAFTEPAKEDDGKTIQIWKRLISERMPIHWGGVSDPFSGFELGNPEKTSLEILKLLAEYQYPVIISTKSKWIVDNKEYMDVLTSNKNLVLQVSLISIREELNKIEPATSIEKRLELIKAVSKTHRVVVRCQPFIPEFSNIGMEEYMQTISKAGAKAVTMEFMKISTFSNDEVKKGIQELSDSIGFDIPKFYKYKGKKSGTDIELRESYKLPILKKFKTLAHMYGMEFYAADNSLRDYGDSPICCGIPVNYPGFENFLTCNVSNMLFKARENGDIRFDDIFGSLRSYEEAFMNQRIAPWLNLGSTESHIKYDDKTFMDKAAFMWDNTSHPNAPCNFFMNIVACGKDEKGHIIYRYKNNEPK